MKFLEEIGLEGTNMSKRQTKKEINELLTNLNYLNKEVIESFRMIDDIITEAKNEML